MLITTLISNSEINLAIKYIKFNLTINNVRD